jgi:regulator of replication initiation timing
LIKELESLRKEVKKYKEMINDMQMENDFLKRTNIQLKLELQKEIQVRTKDAYAQDISKCTLKYANNKSIDD